MERHVVVTLSTGTWPETHGWPLLDLHVVKPEDEDITGPSYASQRLEELICAPRGK